MMYFFICLLAVGAEVSANTPVKPPPDLPVPSVPHTQCGPHQEYLTCGSSCAPTCAGLIASPQSCTTQCIAGCFCKRGYYRDNRGNCVTRDQCSLSVCPRPNEVLKECGSSCERTCANYKMAATSCAAVCVRGCSCRDGYVRNANGICVLPEQCPRQPYCFRPNEEYQACGSSCPITCDTYGTIGNICTTKCVPGCQCKQGYVRNVKDNTCIRPQQCPPLMCHRPNEVAKQCGSCEKTCDNYKRTDISCAAVCVRGCFCRDGYVRNAYGFCVMPNQCPSPVCRPNETYSTCGSACPATCRNRGDTCRVCTAQCVRGCFCNKGLVRADDGTCIAPKDCPRRTCSGPHEVFTECPPTCPPTDNCSELWTKYDCSKFPKCCKPQCRCKSGYARNKNGVCVTTQQCMHGA